MEVISDKTPVVKDDQNVNDFSHISVDSQKTNTTLNRRDKKILICALLVCNFVTQSLYMNVSALLPEFVQDNFPHMDSFQVGLLMAIYPIAFLITAPFIGEKLTYFGRKNSVLAGVLLMTLSTLTFGLAGYAKNVYWFFWISFVARLFQGIADAIIGVSIPSIIATEFADN